jgi:hypothetical protein
MKKFIFENLNKAIHLFEILNYKIIGLDNWFSVSNYFQIA